MRDLRRRQFLAVAGAGLVLSRAIGAMARSEATAAGVVTSRGYTTCRYGQLHYLRGMPVGPPPDRPTLVLLHQIPSSSVEFEYLVQAMATDREVIAFDTPGSGMSDWPPEPMDIAGYTAAFSDGISNLDLAASGAVDVFGFHTGTLLAAELAIANPRRVRRVVLSGIPYRTPDERAERLEQISSGPALTEDGAEILKMQADLWEFVVTRRDPRVPLLRAARLYMEKAKAMDRYWWPYQGVWKYAFEERFPLLRQPVLILQPEEALAEYSRRAAELLSDVQYEPLPGLTRDIFDVGVDQVARALRAYLG